MVLVVLAVAVRKVVAGVMEQTAHAIRVAQATVAEAALAAGVVKAARAEWEDPVAMAVRVTILRSFAPKNSLEQLAQIQTEELAVSLAAPVREAHPA